VKTAITLSSRKKLHRESESLSDLALRLRLEKSQIA